MNPVIKAMLASLLRHGLTSFGSILVARGVWTDAEAAESLAALALLIVSLVWGLFQKYAAHLLILDALDAPGGTTLDELKDQR
jgi:hypothetical protein